MTWGDDDGMRLGIERCCKCGRPIDEDEGSPCSRCEAGATEGQPSASGDIGFNAMRARTPQKGGK